MFGSTIEVLSAGEIEKLLQAMNWVIPEDASPGAGTPHCLAHILKLIDAKGSQTVDIYKRHLGALIEEDLADPSHPLAPLLIDQVKDAYYGYPDTGAWEDVGFVVTA